MNQVVITKKCSKCHETKVLSEFHKNKNKFDGYRNICKMCTNIYNNQHKNPEYNKQYRELNKTILNEYGKQWRIDNSEYVKLNNTIYYNNNKEKLNVQSKQYQFEHKIELDAKRRIRERNRLKSDLPFKLKRNISRRILLALQKNRKSASSEILLGCSIENLKLHLEKQFKIGMSWKNHGIHGWHIDHIKPCNSFDLSDPEQQKNCFHYTNLQPLWAKDNRFKSNKI